MLIENAPPKKDMKQFRVAKKISNPQEIAKLIEEVLDNKFKLGEKNFVLKDATNGMNIYVD